MERAVRLVARGILASLVLLTGCAADPVDVNDDPVVYGTDSREELYQLPAGALRTSALSTVMLTRAPFIDARTPSAIRWNAYNLQQSQDLCADQRYLDQPTPAFCSGTLIDDDLVITAGHCVEDAAACADTRLVFDFHLSAAGQLATVSTADVYSCRTLISRARSTSGAFRDYAILQLDRPVTDRSPVSIGADPAVQATAVLAGHPSGIPLKIDRQGRVAQLYQGAFTATVDAFGGNSGSGVFDANGAIMGVLSGGARDYVPNGSCYVVNTTTGEGETIGLVSLAISDLCATGYPSVRLCPGATVRCGDGVCSTGETSASCPADCGAARDAGTVTSTCGDGVCTSPERTTCQQDCAGDPPSGWLCDRSWYWVGDDCDCRCGAYDPDCDDTSLRILNCRPGQLCSSAGMCTSPGADAAVSVDAASPSVDAAAVAVDAATSARDAATLVVDARTSTVDAASAADAGRLMVTPEPEGGCGCRASSPTSTAASAWWLALGGVLVARRRRRGGA